MLTYQKFILPCTFKAFQKHIIKTFKFINEPCGSIYPLEDVMKKVEPLINTGETMFCTEDKSVVVFDYDSYIEVHTTIPCVKNEWTQLAYRLTLSHYKSTWNSGGNYFFLPKKEALQSKTDMGAILHYRVTAHKNSDGIVHTQTEYYDSPDEVSSEKSLGALPSCIDKAEVYFVYGGLLQVYDNGIAVARISQHNKNQECNKKANIPRLIKYLPEGCYYFDDYTTIDPIYVFYALARKARRNLTKG